MVRRLRRLELFDRFADGANRVFGGSVAFAIAAGAVLLWAAMGPVFGFGEKWQLTINTGTTIVTFLMVFLIQHSQNKQTEALHLKLNELLASHHEASNRLIGVEDLDEGELDHLHRFYRQLGERAEREGPIKRTHSLDDAGGRSGKEPRRRAARRR
ncbi:low affinity iron permease family protein [Solimonas fluminis]|nr:low affinity iron permease family protein [Solimonas fluminis]